MGIYGSRAVMLYYKQMRIAGAQVRKVLMQNAGALAHAIETFWAD